MCVCVLTITVPDVFIPCSRIATRVKTSIRGPYSSPAIFYTGSTHCQRTGPELDQDWVQNLDLSLDLTGVYELELTTNMLTLKLTFKRFLR